MIYLIIILIYNPYNYWLLEDPNNEENIDKTTQFDTSLIEFTEYNISFLYSNDTIFELQGFSSITPDENQGMIIGKNQNTNKKICLSWDKYLEISNEIILSDLFGSLSRFETEKSSIRNITVNEKKVIYQKYNAIKGETIEFGIKGFWKNYTSNKIFLLSISDFEEIYEQEFISFIRNFKD